MDRPRIDLQFAVIPRTQAQTIADSVPEAESFMRQLETLNIFAGVRWDAQFSEGSDVLIYGTDTNRLIEGFEASFDRLNARERELLKGSRVWAVSEPVGGFELKMAWGELRGGGILVEIKRPPLDSLNTPDACMKLIDLAVAWRRPQHVRLGPFIYTRDHHPLDRSRQGIGWMGWIPFDLPAHDLPEAEIVRPMHGGTLIVTQSAFWQAYENHPAFSRDAIERAQEVELKLAMLGMLPTQQELETGTWGQR